MESTNKNLTATLIAFGVGLNFGLATLISLLKLPIYMDAVGTIIITILIGWRAGAITGVLSFVLMTITGFGPFHIYFSLTQVAIALFIHFMASQSMIRNVGRVVISGILLGVVAALVSAPVIVYLFAGVEGNGPGVVTAFLLEFGNTVVNAVLLKGMGVEPIDKTIQLLLAYFVLRGMPDRFKRSFNGTALAKNFS